MARKTMEDLNGFDIIEFKKITGKPLGAVEDEMVAGYVIAFLLMKQDNPDLKIDDVYKMNVKSINEYMGTAAEEEVVMPFEDAPKA